MNERSIFLAALEIENSSERVAYLETACAGNSDLRQRIEQLLQAHQPDDSFLEKPPPNLVATTDAISERPGTRIGPYKLLQEIGEGGMGTVYMAEQEHPIRRMVAVKIIREGKDSKGVLARFEAERQALALMDHPHIAKVFEAGTTDSGRPYFVMELVKGIPITKFCDENQLSLRERLELFVPVCQAIQHAHQKGIIHRDIKPSNVLVAMYDDKPVPKVIDFGIAKATSQRLTEKTLFTEFGMIVGTLEYMSPEQAKLNQLDIDTRSDVYALGVLLYELLTGTTPLDRTRLKSAALDEVLRLIREEEPPRPSTRLSSSQTLPSIAAARKIEPTQLGRIVRGELDWIVMKSLEKDRARRYESANSLAKDIDRYLKGDAVEACPPTLGYRLRKAYRKNKAAITAATIIALLLIGGTIVSLWQAERAKIAETKATENYEYALGEQKKAIESSEESTRQKNDAIEANNKLRLAQAEMRSNQYIWDMQMMPVAWESGNIPQAMKLIDRHQPMKGMEDLRNFEWHYWDRQVHPELSSRILAEDANQRNYMVLALADGGDRVAFLHTPASVIYPNAQVEMKNFLPTVKVFDSTNGKELLSHPVLSEELFQRSMGATPSGDPKWSPDGNRIAFSWRFSARSAIGQPRTPTGPKTYLQVVDIPTKKVLLDLIEEPTVPRSIIEQSYWFSPNGRKFALVNTFLQEKTSTTMVKVWDLESRKELFAIQGIRLVKSPFSPDGSRLLGYVPDATSNSSSQVKLWDSTTGKELQSWELTSNAPSSLVFSPDGIRLAGLAPGREKTDDSLLKVWDSTNGKEHFSIPLNARGTDGYPFFSPDGSRLAIAQVTNRSKDRLWEFTFYDSIAGKKLSSVVIQDNLRSLGFGPSFPRMSPDGKQFVTSITNVINVWDTTTGNSLLTLRGHTDRVIARTFTPDGKRLWSVDKSGMVKEWSLQSVKPITVPLGEMNTASRDFILTPDGNWIAHIHPTGKEPNPSLEVRVSDIQGKGSTTLIPGPREFNRPSSWKISISRDGRRVALLRGESFRTLQTKKEQQKENLGDLTIWDVASRKELFHVEIPATPGSLVMSPDGKSVAIAILRFQKTDRTVVKVFDIETKQERQTIKVPAPVVDTLSFSMDGNRIAGMTMEPINRGSPLQISTKLMVWNTLTGDQLWTMDLGSDAWGREVAWSPDGSKLAVTGTESGEKGISVLDSASGKLITRLELALSGSEVTGGFRSIISFSPDGKRLAGFLSSTDTLRERQIKVWDSISGKELLTLQTPSGRSNGNSFSGMPCIAFTEDGHRLIACELANESRSSDRGFGLRNTTLVITTWDATPRHDPKP
jgi:eukaryotic-like serine/threonine-protein kinase